MSEKDEVKKRARIEIECVEVTHIVVKCLAPTITSIDKGVVDF